MFRVLFFWCLCISVAAASVTDSEVWINEFHYDNDGADELEFVEVAAPLAWNDLSEFTLTLYNGSNGTAYGGPVALDDFSRGVANDTFVFYWLDLNMQNGAPDGLALARGNELLQFISYEGSFLATDGVAVGHASTDIGVLETTTTPLGHSLQLGGVGDSYLDFHWQSPLAHTQGTLNVGQSTVPEPATALLWALAGGGISLYFLRSLRRR